MLLVLCAIVYLYIAPARSLIETLHAASSRHATLVQLQVQHSQLTAQEKALESPDALEEAARSLGLVQQGEHPYVISGLPSN
jgi:cell division protein FtsB